MPPASDQSDRQHDGLAPAEQGISLRRLHLALPADWITPSIARNRVRDWLDAHSWPAGQIDDLVLAVSEAVSNCIEHGYAITSKDYTNSSDVIDVDGQVQMEPDRFRRTVLVVRDRGQWRVPTHYPAQTRGHGLTVMRGCVDELTIEHDDQGTTITMRSRPVPPPNLPG